MKSIKLIFCSARFKSIVDECANFLRGSALFMAAVASFVYLASSLLGVDDTFSDVEAYEFALTMSIMWALITYVGKISKYPYIGTGVMGIETADEIIERSYRYRHEMRMALSALAVSIIVNAIVIFSAYWVIKLALSLYLYLRLLF